MLLLATAALGWTLNPPKPPLLVVAADGGIVGGVRPADPTNGTPAPANSLYSLYNIILVDITLRYIYIMVHDILHYNNK